MGIHMATIYLVYQQRELAENERGMITFDNVSLAPAACFENVNIRGWWAAQGLLQTTYPYSNTH